MSAEANDPREEYVFTKDGCEHTLLLTEEDASRYPDDALKKVAAKKAPAKPSPKA